MGNGDEIDGFGEEGQEGNESVSVVVGLVVEDYTRLVWWMVDGRHGFLFGFTAQMEITGLKPIKAEQSTVVALFVYRGRDWPIHSKTGHCHLCLT